VIMHPRMYHEYWHSWTLSCIVALPPTVDAYERY
jgi:hypothetical protein